ncbi:phosphodiester glycosidase family protein [Georgenia sp. SUBG003]|uniref:phosphodiester glycosidase family protein n=1 Tax=Georgenia sp. SUBG003 TaxID=1497974 RepID=UPI000693646C
MATGALVPVILLAGVIPAHASTEPADDPRGLDSAPVLDGADPAAGRLPAASSDVSEPGGLLAAEPGDQRILLEETERPVAPGLDLRSFQWLDAGGFQRGDVLTARLGTEGLSLDYLDNGTVTSPGPLSASADRAGAVAGVNGDFFDINNSGSALGAGLSQDGVVKGPNPGRHSAVGVDSQGLAQLTAMYLEGEIVTPDGSLPLKGLNQNALDAGEIGAYTTLWGAYSRDRATSGTAHKREVVVTDGVVTSVSPTPGEGRLAENAVALVGREAGADALAGLEVGDEVAVSYGLRSTAGEMAVAVGGNQHLVRDGEPQVHGDKTVHPRTAVGFTEDRATMFLVTVDGRMSESRGMSLDELGEFMAELGAHTAVNLDGGGSSTLVAREAGEDAVTVENAPSDGYERSVPNGLALFAAEGSGNVTGLRLVPAADDADPTWRRVFPGLTRDLDALAHDETYAPVEGDPRYTATPAAVGKIDPGGIFRAGRSGDATVTARQAGASGELGLVVLGELARLRPTVGTIAIKDAEDTGRFGIVGHDADGFEAPVEPGDVDLDYDASKITVEPDGAGGFVVTPVAESAGVVITATVGDVVTHVPVSVGLESQVVATFDDAADWQFSTARGAGSLEPTEGRDGGTALEINYDFTRSTATRTANARAPQNIVVDGQPQSIGLWVRGDGRGQWWSFSVLDANGTYYPLYGPHITWEGWRYVEVDVPQNIPFPMTVYRFGIIETAASEQYAGSVAIDDITVKVAPHVETPAAPVVTDDVVVTDGAAVDDGDHSFAVVSDAQFTASNQSLVPAARRTLREAVAADPDFVVINGDWVDTAFPDDLALARRVIEEEIGDTRPWYYVPGNHEILGPGDVAAFEEEFGPAHQSFVHGGHAVRAPRLLDRHAPGRRVRPVAAAAHGAGRRRGGRGRQRRRRHHAHAAARPGPGQDQPAGQLGRGRRDRGLAGGVPARDRQGGRLRRLARRLLLGQLRRRRPVRHQRERGQGTVDRPGRRRVLGLDPRGRQPRRRAAAGGRAPPDDAGGRQPVVRGRDASARRLAHRRRPGLGRGRRRREGVGKRGAGRAHRAGRLPGERRLDVGRRRDRRRAGARQPPRRARPGHRDAHGAARRHRGPDRHRQRGQRDRDDRDRGVAPG